MYRTLVSRGFCHALVVRVLIGSGLAAAGPRSQGGDEDGFRALFDGRTLSGWSAPEMHWWSVEDGAITGTITRDRPCTTNQYLVWQGGELADFELKLESRLSGEGAINNGFQFRSRVLPDGDVAGYQMDNNLQTDWLVRLYDEFGRHTLAWRGQRTVFAADGSATRSDLPEGRGPAWFRLEGWHEYHLLCRGAKLRLSVDGRLAAEIEDHDVRRADPQGILALQLHSGPPTRVQFRNIRLRVLRPADPPSRPFQDGRRRRIRESAVAYWDLGTGGHQRRHPLGYVGSLDDMELNVRAHDPRLAGETRVALLRGGHFQTGPDLNPGAEALTVGLRAQDPTGNWNAALMSKRDAAGFHFDLYSVAGEIGFEIGTAAGRVKVSFPITRADPAAWHDIAGRYDGRAIQLFCDGRLMAERAWEGGPLQTNRAPLLVGAETDAGRAVRHFHGELAEAALWDRALNDRELAAWMRVGRVMRAE